MRLQDLSRYGVATAPRVRPAPAHRPVESLLTGHVADLGARSSFYREERFESSYRHGSHRIADVGAVSGHRLGMISRDAELSYSDAGTAAFLDTETTGLGMGAGTYVFLVGVGYLAPDGFRVRQFFLGGPGDELVYLRELGQFLARFSMIVTFNGKAFDWPLLEGRFARFRMRPPLSDPPHVDLLHPSRSLWRRRLESCALTSLEREVLDVRRTQDDVPGYEIPGRYFSYLRGADGSQLAGVFYHNLQDILSLAALALRVDAILADPYSGLLAHGTDYLSLGRVYERAGEAERAAGAYEEALRTGLDREQRCDCLTRLGLLQKRQRWWEAALATWDHLLDEGSEYALFALVEMAKYYEHVEGDYAQALEAARGALALAELRPSLADELASLEHRLGRLVNRASNRRRTRTRL